MKPISSIIIDFLNDTITNKNLGVYCSEHGKIFVLNEEYDTLFKFDLNFSDSDFSCQILMREKAELKLKYSFNISWTDGKAIRNFMKQVEALFDSEPDMQPAKVYPKPQVATDLSRIKSVIV